jgi:uracil-DNA glycosylase
MATDSWNRLERELVACRRCPRLVRWREAAAGAAPASLRGATYWSRPVPGFGDRRAPIVLVGLAPGAHGANRTGRPFTGDGAGPFLYGALHRAGLANRPVSVARGDGLELVGARITNAVRCAPPGNLPAPDEFERCSTYLARELDLAHDARVLVCLGGHAWKAVFKWLRERGHAIPRPAPRFGHGAEATIGPYLVLGAFHPSQLNTRTGRLTAPMLDAVLRRAVEGVASEREDLRERGDPGRHGKAVRHSGRRPS